MSSARTTPATRPGSCPAAAIGHAILSASATSSASHAPPRSRNLPEPGDGMSAESPRGDTCLVSAKTQAPGDYHTHAPREIVYRYTMGVPN